jgi:molybdopterin-guanine dinucleotide biosynthesis protein A
MRSIAILAGGRATRFDGRDKSALVVDGRTILDRQLAEFTTLTDDVMIVGDGHARSRSLVSTVRAEGARAFQASVREIRDIVPGCGPLGGLHAALTAAHGDAVFVVACDMPYVTAAFADYLFSLGGDAQIVVPRTERGYHPLCAVYARACLGPVATRLANEQLALRDLMNDVPVRVVTENEIARFGASSRLLANVNTPAEYADLEALQDHKL